MAAELWCAPDTRHGFFQACRREFGFALRRQPPGDLGRRMAHALLAGVRQGPVVLVGTDCPGLRPEDLRAAGAALREFDAVLQPSSDGGYVLIGVRQLEPRSLNAIAWSSGRELAQTRRRFARFGMRWTELPARDDVDTPADWRQARRAGLV